MEDSRVSMLTTRFYRNTRMNTLIPCDTRLMPKYTVQSCSRMTIGCLAFCRYFHYYYFYTCEVPGIEFTLLKFQLGKNAIINVMSSLTWYDVCAYKNYWTALLCFFENSLGQVRKIHMCCLYKGVSDLLILLFYPRDSGELLPTLVYFSWFTS